MMNLADISRNVAAAFALAKRDRRGLEMFDTGLAGFWRSFTAALILIPPYILMEIQSGGFGDPPTAFGVVAQTISYSIQWTLFPLIMIIIADSLKVFGNYYRYIIASNWASVVQMMIMLPLSMLAAIYPGPATLLLAQCVVILVLIYRAYVAHVALGVGIGLSAAIVFVDVALSAILHSITLSIIGN